MTNPKHHIWVDECGRPRCGLERNPILSTLLPFRPSPTGLRFRVKEGWLRAVLGDYVIVSWEDLNKMAINVRNKAATIETID